VCELIQNNIEIEKLKIEKAENENLGFAGKPFNFLKSILNEYYFPKKLDLSCKWGAVGKYSNNRKFIENHKIGTEGARAIGEALKKNNSLTSLDLSIFLFLFIFEL